MVKSMEESCPASSRSGQSSLEYLMIVAITFLVIVPTTYLFYSYSRESGQEITDSQITKMGRNMVDAAESIFYSGQGSKTVLDLDVPESVHNVTIISGREIVFKTLTNSGFTEIVFFSQVNITASSSNCEMIGSAFV